jgi:hypothetical protein
MGKNLQDKVTKVALVRGHPVHKVNPSLSENLPTRIKSQNPSLMGEAYMVAPGTGEIVARGAFGFIQEQEVDTEQFVKIYLAGVQQYGKLTKAGASLFEFVYEIMSGREAKDKDTITISLALAQERNPKLAKTTYYRGLNELLDQGFLFRSYDSTDHYFVNVRFIFNGDRMVLVQSYRVKGTTTGDQLDSYEPFVDVDSTAIE